MRLKKAEGDVGDAIVACSPTGDRAIMQDRVEQVQRLATKHIQLQVRQLAAELEVDLRCRAQAAHAESQEAAKQSRLQLREAVLNDERERRQKERQEYESYALAKAKHLEWATAAERLHQQDCLELRRCEAGLARAAERERLAALRRQRQEAMELQLQAHEAAERAARDRKAAEYDGKIARVAAMEARRDEMLEDVARMRREAYAQYEGLKALAHDSAVMNDDRALRRVLEELVPRLSALPHTPRSTWHPARGAQRRSLSAGPASTPRLAPAAARRRPTSARGGGGRGAEGFVPTSAAAGRLAGFVPPRRSLSPSAGAAKSPTAKGTGNASRNTSVGSLGGSALFSSQSSWDSVSNASPVATVASQPSARRVATTRLQLCADPAGDRQGGSPCPGASPTDCPLCCSTPRRR